MPYTPNPNPQTLFDVGWWVCVCVQVCVGNKLLQECLPGMVKSALLEALVESQVTRCEALLQSKKSLTQVSVLAWGLGFRVLGVGMRGGS
jgi:hypothetical protein